MMEELQTKFTIDNNPIQTKYKGENKIGKTN
jgi:hypothetical protein